MPDLLEEIKEDIKQEKLEKLWQDTGSYIIGAIVAAILTTAGYVFYKNYNIGKYEKFGTELYSAYMSESQQKVDQSIKGYESVSKNSDPNISAIASMRKANLLVSEGESDKATEIYKDISDDAKNPVEIRDLAEILYLHNAIQYSENKDVSLINRLEEMASTSGPFQYTAKEMLAFVLFKNREYNEAKVHFTELSKELLVPNRMKDRANEMIDAINLKSNDANG